MRFDHARFPDNGNLERWCASRCASIPVQPWTRKADCLWLPARGDTSSRHYENTSGSYRRLASGRQILLSFPSLSIAGVLLSSHLFLAITTLFRLAVSFLRISSVSPLYDFANSTANRGDREAEARPPRWSSLLPFPSIDNACLRYRIAFDWKCLRCVLNRLILVTGSIYVSSGKRYHFGSDERNLRGCCRNRGAWRLADLASYFSPLLRRFYASPLAHYPGYQLVCFWIRERPFAEASSGSPESVSRQPVAFTIRLEAPLRDPRSVFRLSRLRLSFAFHYRRDIPRLCRETSKVTPIRTIPCGQ